MDAPRFIKLHVVSKFTPAAVPTFFNLERILTFQAKSGGGAWVMCSCEREMLTQVEESPEQILALMGAPLFS
ncbi:MAG: hypothetical protein EOP88_13945 [Verrucomicrobiaceae bacterium]|nr:MAG: hypothetical protein EOP88_13945 [Verrucomicrobiaceae bacterium]